MVEKKIKTKYKNLESLNTEFAGGTRNTVYWL